MTTDTPPEFERLVAERFRAMSGEQRFLIGVEMFETARTLALAALPEGASDRQQRRHLCQRFYPELADRAFPPGEARLE